MYNNVTKRQRNRRCFKLIAMMTTSKVEMMLMTLLLVLNTLATVGASAKSEINNLNAKEASKSTKNEEDKLHLRQYLFNGLMMQPPAIPPSIPGCPLCDSSVYSYCSYKLIHDSCCCEFSGAAIYQKPPQCAYNDCSLLYAKSCYEHSLIRNCCCNNPY